VLFSGPERKNCRFSDGASDAISSRPTLSGAALTWVKLVSIPSTRVTGVPDTRAPRKRWTS